MLDLGSLVVGNRDFIIKCLCTLMGHVIGLGTTSSSRVVRLVILRCRTLLLRLIPCFTIVLLLLLLRVAGRQALRLSLLRLVRVE